MIPLLKKVIDQDILGAPLWFKPIQLTINNFMQNTFAILKRQITFQDNIRCEIKELKLTAPVVSFSVPITIPKPLGVILLGIEGKDFTSEPAIRWSTSQKAILIESLSGLTAGNEYKVRILII